MAEPLHDGGVDLGLVGTIELKLALSDAQLLGNVLDVLWPLSPRNSNIGRNRSLELEGKGNNLAGRVGLGEADGRGDNVLKEHGNSHWANSSGDGGNLGGNLDGRLKVNVSDETLARLLGGIGNVVGANVNDDGSGLEPLALDKVGLANGRDDNVGLSENVFEAGSLGVADGDGSIGILEEVRDGRADDIGAAENNGKLASGVYASLLEEDHDSLGSAGGKERLASALGKLADVEGAKAVDILLGRDSLGDGKLVEVLGDGELDEDAVNVGVVVEGFNVFNELLESAWEFFRGKGGKPPAG